MWIWWGKNLIQINGRDMINVDASIITPCMWRRLHLESFTCSCENGKYLASVMDDSAIMCDESIESYDQETKTILINFNEKKAICNTQNFYILLAFFYYYSIIDSY